MIVPSIDIRTGRAVQLRGGRHPVLDVGDPEEVAERYARVGEIAIVDLDAALGTGDNSETVLRILRRHPCRVGGGLRTKEAVLRYLDAGARSVMLGTKASPEFLSELPRDRLIAALDEKGGEVVVEGWTKGTGSRIEDRMAVLAPYVSGFLVTFVDAEGSLGGIGLDRVRSLIASAEGVRITFAGGAAGAEEIGALDRLGADVQAGTAIALGKLELAEAFAASLLVRSAGRPLAHGRLRRGRQGARPRMVGPREPRRSDRDRPRRLQVPQPRSLGEGGDFRRPAGADPRRGRLRQGRDPLHSEAERTRILPSRAAKLLRRRLRDRAPRADA